MTITTRQRYLIAAETLVDPRTIAKVYEGRRTRGTARERIVEAARALGISPPPAKKVVSP